MFTSANTSRKLQHNGIVASRQTMQIEGTFHAHVCHVHRPQLSLNHSRRLGNTTVRRLVSHPWNQSLQPIRKQHRENDRKAYSHEANTSLGLFVQGKEYEILPDSFLCERACSLPQFG